MRDDFKLADLLADGDLINFGDLDPQVNAILQQGVAAYWDDRPKAEVLFRQALEVAPQELAIYFCLYKIHTYQGQLDEGLAAAKAGVSEAARQANLAQDWWSWTPEERDWTELGVIRFALYTLKAMAFIHLRREEPAESRRLLDHIKRLDPKDSVGRAVIEALAARLGA
jgi:tetratricopeptide (TPR) repeat protein